EMPKPNGPRAMLDVSGIRWSLGGAKPNFSSEEIAAMLKEGAAADEQLDFAVSDPKTAAMLLDAMKATPAKRARLEGGVTAALLPAIRERGVVVVQHGAPAKDE